MAASGSSADPPRAARPQRPLDRAGRLGTRWEEPPINVVRREVLEEEGAEANSFAKSGRLSVYAFNFGEESRPAAETPVMKHLMEHNAHVLVAQEVTIPMATLLREKGWHTSDDRYIGLGRASGGDGVMIAARGEVSVGVETLTEVSGSICTPKGERSSFVFAKVKLRWAFANFVDYSFGSFHLHRDTAKRGLGSPDLRRFVECLAQGCRASGARLLCGDANMGLFLIAPGLQHLGYECRLLMHHREMDILQPLPEHVGWAAAQLRYDSMGVWSVGPLSQSGVKRLTLSSRLVLGALHPAVGARNHRTGRVKCLSRGYPKRSYVTPQFEEAPTEEDLDRVRLLWDLHNIERIGTDAPARSRPGTETWTLTRDVDVSADPNLHDPVQVITATAAAHLLFEGEKIAEMLKANGIDLSFEWTGPSPDAPAAGVNTSSWAPLPHIREMQLNWRKFDQHGELWGLGGHFPLYFVIGSVRTKSAEAGVVRRVALAKKEQWQSSGSWPWWVAHESEKTYWLPGYWWRHSRAGLSTRQREEADAQWIAMYGREAYDAAVQATEHVLALPFPPDDDPNSLSAAAASGQPWRWPWHIARRLRDEEESREAREDHSRSGAFPFVSPLAAARVDASQGLRSRTPMAAPRP